MFSLLNYKAMEYFAATFIGTCFFQKINWNFTLFKNHAKKKTFEN